DWPLQPAELLHATQPTRRDALRQRRLPFAVDFLDVHRIRARDAGRRLRGNFLAIDLDDLRGRFAELEREPNAADVGRFHGEARVSGPQRVNFGAVVVPLQTEDLDPVARRVLQGVRGEAYVVRVLRTALARPGELGVLGLRLRFPFLREFVLLARGDEQRHRQV